MLTALHKHNKDSADRNKQFANMLPGMSELDPAKRRSLIVGWKWLAFWMVTSFMYLFMHVY